MGCKPKRMVSGVVYLQYRMRKSGGAAPGKVWAEGRPVGAGFSEKALRCGMGTVTG